MRYAPLPPQSPIYPEEAANYARITLERSQAALDHCELVAHQSYGPDYWQSVDVYPAREQNEDGTPVLIFAHGGAWTNGYKEWMGLMAPALTQAGITLVSVSYRLAPQHKWHEMLEDCLNAIAWVSSNIQRYGGNPRHIALGGHSAGGHLMALAALSSERLVALGIDLLSIVGCVPLCAPLDIRYPHRQPGSGEERTHQMILGNSSEAAAASPICHVQSNSPYIFLAYARNDLPRIINSNLAMTSELERLNVAHDVLVLEGDHFSAALDAAHEESAWMKRTIGLLRPGVQP